MICCQLSLIHATYVEDTLEAVRSLGNADDLGGLRNGGVVLGADDDWPATACGNLGEGRVCLRVEVVLGHDEDDWVSVWHLWKFRMELSIRWYSLGMFSSIKAREPCFNSRKISAKISHSKLICLDTLRVDVGELLDLERTLET